MRRLVFKETALGLGSGSLASNGRNPSTSLFPEYVRVKENRKILMCKTGGGMEICEIKTQTPRGAGEGRIRGLRTRMLRGPGLEFWRFGSRIFAARQDSEIGGVHGGTPRGWRAGWWFVPVHNGRTNLADFLTPRTLCRQLGRRPSFMVRNTHR